MSGLLVSVRDAAEAAVAIAAGVDLIDVKEPRRGSLGRADADTIRQVVDVVAGHTDGRAAAAAAGDVLSGQGAFRSVPVSVALGELVDLQSSVVAACSARVQFAKIGLAGCDPLPDWRERWALTLDALPAEVCRVAVVYADWRLARAPGPADILRAANELRCGAVLVDTFDKRAGGLVDHWSLDELDEWIGGVRSRGMLAVVAGSMTLASLARVLPLAPDYVAVRGAACSSSRTGTICRNRLAELVSLVQRQGSPQDLSAVSYAARRLLAGRAATRES